MATRKLREVPAAQARGKESFEYASAGPSVIDELLKGLPDAEFVEPPARHEDAFTDAMNAGKCDSK